ncbi:macro domain-containing protein [Mediannikoviicoccus vaginalis]|uniref:macro domain-containing protein n=1 Tax=Mediannikoviicoccus vaginalis TaxID=2899727 RepID=UPI001F1EDE5B|nr:macro domain-containing protein [Mediannikoviicoccus vaginalis]
MDIRITFEDIFEIESDGLVFFSDNALLDEGSNSLIENAGERVLLPLSKVQGVATGDVKLIPGFDLKQLYIFLTVLPEDIESKLNQKLFKDSFKKIIELSKEYNLESIAINLNYLKERYGEYYIDCLNRVLRSDDYKFEDLIVFLCG